MAHGENSPRSLDPFRFLERLPEFSGDRKELYSFISLIDRLNPLLSQYEEVSQLVFFDLIKSKLKGRAREVAEINFHIESWEEMRTILTNNFGEKRSLEELYDRLRAVVFRTNVIDFYNEIKERLRSLNNKTCTDLGINSDSEQMARSNMMTALNIFKSKIPEPMKTVLACRNPDTIENAMDILFSSGYAHYGGENRSNNLKKIDNSGARSNRRTHVNVDCSNRGSINNNNRFNGYNHHSYGTQNNHGNVNRSDNGNRYRYDNGQSNSGNRNTTHYNYNNGRSFANNPSNCQNYSSFSEPMDINILQNSGKISRPPTKILSSSNSIQTNNKDDNLPNQYSAIQNFPFQASAGNFLI